jgi:hypothetical protein
MIADYSIISLPQTYTDTEWEAILPVLIQQLKSLRLESLRLNPEAFGSTYEREVAFPDSTWEERLKSSVARIVIATDAAHSSASPVKLAATANWLGSAVLIGPRVLTGQEMTASQSPYELFQNAKIEEEITDANDRPTVRMFAINGVYVRPAGRSKGIGKSPDYGAREVCRD